MGMSNPVLPRGWALKNRPVLAGLALAAALALGASPALAGGHNFFAFSFGFPIYAGPPVVYGPPAYYAPPPPVYYYPPPANYPPAATAAPSAGTSQGAIVTPYSGQGQATGNCREYQTTTTINGVPQKSYGTACLQADGTWRIVN